MQANLINKYTKNVRLQYMYDNISLNSYWNEKWFRQKLKRKSKHTFYVQYLLRKSCRLWNNVGNYIVQPERPQTTIHYGACVLHAGYLRLTTHTEYVILIAFPLQHWCHECVSLLRHTYAACLVRLPTTPINFCFSNQRMSPLQQTPHTETPHIVSVRFVPLRSFSSAIDSWCSV
jgi:hypothetical protein